MRNMDKAMKALSYEKDKRFKKGYHGFDGVYKNKKTGQLAVAEAKYSKKGGLSSLLATVKGGFKQMSEPWVRSKAAKVPGKLGKELRSVARKNNLDRILVVTSKKGVKAKDLNTNKIIYNKSKTSYSKGNTSRTYGKSNSGKTSGRGSRKK